VAAQWEAGEVALVEVDREELLLQKLRLKIIRCELPGSGKKDEESRRTRGKPAIRKKQARGQTAPKLSLQRNLKPSLKKSRNQLRSRRSSPRKKSRRELAPLLLKRRQRVMHQPAQHQPAQHQPAQHLGRIQHLVVMCPPQLLDLAAAFRLLGTLFLSHLT
jgi:hypothetical protein